MGDAGASRRGGLLARLAVLRPFARDRRGVTMVEFAIIAVPLFVLLFGILEVALVAWASYELENATEDVGRMIRTGQPIRSTEAGIKDAICQRVALLANCAAKLQVSVQNFDRFADVAAPNPLSGDGLLRADLPYQPGGAQRIVLMTSYYEWPLINFSTSASIGNLPNGDRLLQASSVFRNEPFPNP
jgi:Flp pilus assembly protein TadG